MLGQSETTILVDPRLPSKIYQGITTEITGEGGSAAPLNDAIIANDRPGYAVEGKILAFGYMKGIMDALHLPYA